MVSRHKACLDFTVGGSLDAKVGAIASHRKPPTITTGTVVMMLAANRKSTGIGVRPRGNRVEVTADFTPDASLMIATGSEPWASEGRKPRPRMTGIPSVAK